MTQGDLVISVAIKHKGKSLGKFSKEINDDILGFVRERVFGLANHIEKVWGMAIKEALENYDKGLWEK